MGLLLWTHLFLEAQGYHIEDNIFYQDNKSTILLANTCHIDIRYYFVTDQVTKKWIRIEHCPTTAMLGYFFTKPLQGNFFGNLDVLL